MKQSAFIDALAQDITGTQGASGDVVYVASSSTDKVIEKEKEDV